MGSIFCLKAEGIKSFRDNLKEMSADAMGVLFASEDGAKSLVSFIKNNNTIEEQNVILKFLKELFDAICNMFKNSKANSD